MRNVRHVLLLNEFNLLFELGTLGYAFLEALDLAVLVLALTVEHINLGLLFLDELHEAVVVSLNLLQYDLGGVGEILLACLNLEELLVGALEFDLKAIIFLQWVR